MSGCPHVDHCETLAALCDACCEGAWPPFHFAEQPAATHPGHVWECPLCTPVEVDEVTARLLGMEW